MLYIFPVSNPFEFLDLFFYGITSKGGPTLDSPQQDCHSCGLIRGWKKFDIKSLAQ
jgi:hypothetical protein